MFLILLRIGQNQASWREGVVLSAIHMKSVLIKILGFSVLVEANIDFLPLSVR